MEYCFSLTKTAALCIRFSLIYVTGERPVSDFTFAGVADNYTFFMDGYREKPVRDIEISDFYVRQALHPYYMFCTDQVRILRSLINGDPVPEQPEEHTERVSLEVY
ncbi:MAG: hypothetical protein LUF85_00150 [Bacteroides sp.]|nr:hypothetical protein [Bacteroides sp.]